MRTISYSKLPIASVLGVLLLIGGASYAGQYSKSKGHGEQRGQGNFPSYGHSQGGQGKWQSAAVPQNRSAKAHVQVRPDSMGNRVTEDHLSRVSFAHDREDIHMRGDVQVNSVVSRGRARFTNFYRPEFEKRTIIFNSFVTHYNGFIVNHPVVWEPWHRHSFYGGFYWGFHPIADIDVYFYNPMVYWFYAPAFDETYYRTWYKTEYDAYPELHKPFNYHGVYYPTENLKQLLFGVSAMPVEKQGRFRIAIEVFTKKIAQQIANNLGRQVKISNGDIALTHYEIIGYDDAVVTEGIVNFGGEAYNFKGLIDLENPQSTMTFVPTSLDKTPNTEDLARLDSINNRIDALKGVPSTHAIVEPVDVVPAPAEVIAEPER